MQQSEFIDQIEQIKGRLREIYCGYDKAENAHILSLLQEAGDFCDIDYCDQSRANWAPILHLERSRKLSCAYQQDVSLGKYIQNAIVYWFRYDFMCPNWFYNELAVPQQLRIILLNCGDIFEEDIKNKMLCRLQTEIDPKWSGMNRLWFAENVVFHGILSGDVKLVQKGRNYIAETIYVSEEGNQGVQVDGSFAQHGMQLYNHGYGNAFISNAARWFALFHDTAFAFEKETIKVITDLYLNGTAKMGRFAAMDFSAMGRNIVRCYNPDKHGRTMRFYKEAAKILISCNKEPETVDKLQKTMDFFDGKRKNPYEECNTAYWCLKFMTHHRDGFYSSVRMASKEVSGGECINGENYLGGFGAYGLCIYMRDGQEYEDIFPVLDWGCLPGTTTPHVEMCAEIGVCHESEFVGNVSDGRYGVAAADMYKTYTYDGETASFGGKQAYFFLDECVLHLGADLYSTSEKEFHTTLDQCWLKTDVYADGRKLDKETMQDLVCYYIYHNHKAYINLDKVPLKLKTGKSTGNYGRIYVSETAPKQEITGDTFTLVMPHDKRKAGYQYAVMPDTDVLKAEAFVENPPFEILCNDGKMQAVWYKDVLYAVFYEAGDLNLQGETLVLHEQNEKKAGTLSVDKPCMLIWHMDKQKIYVSTPDKEVDEIVIRINKRDYGAKMPEDRRYRGCGVEVNIV